jgi:hypothetical protein
VRRHREPWAPAFKFSQAGAAGPQGALTARTFSFDDAHPAVAQQHCLRTQQQNEAIKDVLVGGGAVGVVCVCVCVVLGC